MFDRKMQLWSALAKWVKAAPGSTHLGVYLARTMFRVNVVGLEHDHVWDETTLVMRKALKRNLKDGDRVLDLGTGQLGILSIYSAKICRVQVLGVDINAAYIRNAALAARASNALGTEFRTSNWFSDVGGRYNVIFSNIPYVPTSHGLGRKHPSLNREVWDGGPDGCTHARRIIREAPRHLAEGGRLLLGANALYLSPHKVESLVKESSALQLREVVSSSLSPSKVCVLAGRSDGQEPVEQDLGGH